MLMSVSSNPKQGKKQDLQVEWVYLGAHSLLYRMSVFTACDSGDFGQIEKGRLALIVTA